MNNVNSIRQPEESTSLIATDEKRISQDKSQIEKMIDDILTPFFTIHEYNTSRNLVEQCDSCIFFFRSARFDRMNNRGLIHTSNILFTARDIGPGLSVGNTRDTVFELQNCAKVYKKLTQLVNNDDKSVVISDKSLLSVLIDKKYSIFIRVQMNILFKHKNNDMFLSCWERKYCITKDSITDSMLPDVGNVSRIFLQINKTSLDTYKSKSFLVEELFDPSKSPQIDLNIGEKDGKYQFPAGKFECPEEPILPIASKASQVYEDVVFKFPQS